MSSEGVIDRRGSPLCVAPLERHEFVGRDFECSVCHRPRAVHVSHDTVAIPSNVDPRTTPIRSVSFTLALRGRLLTDRDIEKYERMGYYSAEFKEARRALWAKRKTNFVSREGRLIYCP